ncbi:uncharacterized protein EHS24_005712 [Apiotrichum porosum]|uniref:Uncharacterized protein n=1 Tax=Apiotrichum porosum TaxID=105984 RepID=A0A427XZG3_9TREE|nr:uncharacterized protein EHS24_005712 [Apiotrichum porosum]RSH84203.1 hypothetical protein EHS24_005712 [Apiotrichum porosum]
MESEAGAEAAYLARDAPPAPRSSSVPWSATDPSVWSTAHHSSSAPSSTSPRFSSAAWPTTDPSAWTAPRPSSASWPATDPSPWSTEAGSSSAAWPPTQPLAWSMPPIISEEGGNPFDERGDGDQTASPSPPPPHSSPPPAHSSPAHSSSALSSPALAPAHSSPVAHRPPTEGSPLFLAGPSSDDDMDEPASSSPEAVLLSPVSVARYQAHLLSRNANEGQDDMDDVKMSEGDDSSDSLQSIEEDDGDEPPLTGHDDVHAFGSDMLPIARLRDRMDEDMRNGTSYLRRHQGTQGEILEVYEDILVRTAQETVALLDQVRALREQEEQ